MKFQTTMTIALLLTPIATPAIAQSLIVPDTTLGVESSIMTPRPGFEAITGGATRGTGLFHSFSEFSVGDRLNAQFLVAPNIQIIFARVTGDVASDILGTLGTKLDDGINPSNASLMLLNPKGILFGPNAKLDLAGSFLATTANSIKLAEAQEFSTVSPVPLLTISVPTGLQFGPQVGDITLDRTSTIVPQSLSLFGGNTRLNQTVLISKAGQLEIAALGSGATIDLNLTQNRWIADYQTANNFSDITINNNNTIAIDNPNAAAGAAAGDVRLRGRNILLNNPTQTPSLITANGNSSITITASDRLLLQGVEITTFNPSTGGNITITSPIIQQQDRTYITTLLLTGQGKAGDINIKADQSFSLTNGSDRRPSTVASFLRDGAIGSTGNIAIDSPAILIQDGATVGVESNGGSTGIVSLQSPGSILLSGISPDGDQTQIFNRQNGTNAATTGISINTKSLTVDNGARISTIGSADGSSKTIEITVTEDVIVRGGNSAILPFRGENITVGLPSKISTAKLNGSGSSGDISIRAQNVQVLAGADIESEIGQGNDRFQGKAGNININASDLVLVDGQSSQKILETLDYYNPSNISSSVALDGNAQAGNITINSNRIEVKAGGVISSDTRGQGNAGNIDLNASDRIVVIGEGRSGLSAISSATYISGQGDSGQIQVKAKALTIADGGAINTSTVGSGKAGQVFVTIAGPIAIQGRSVNGNSSNISSSSFSYGTGDRETLLSTLQILGGTNFPSAEASGAGGDLVITGDRLNLSGGAEIAALSTGQGAAGNIVLRLRDRAILNDGNIKTTAEKTSGGNIGLTAKVLLLRNNSNIKTQVLSGVGQGGNINLTAPSGIVLLEDSDILAFAQDGRGGNITLNTPALLTRTYKPSDPTADLKTLDTNGFVDINATGATSGIITLPDLNPLQNNRPELPQGLLDADKALSRSCLARNPNTGKFYITGTGGIPPQPGDPSLSNYSTLPVASTATEPTQIVEADGFYPLDNGKFVFGKACQAVIPDRS
jgi:filamentous hemagglutinin family protein